MLVLRSLVCCCVVWIAAAAAEPAAPKDNFWQQVYDARVVIYESKIGQLPNDIAVMSEYGGPVAGEDSAELNVKALGNKHQALLANHGVLVVAESISSAWIRARCLEWRCKQAWYVEAIGGWRAMPKEGRDWLAETMAATGGVARTQWPWVVRRELRADPSVLDDCAQGGRG